MENEVNRKVGDVLMLSPRMAEHKFSISEELALAHYWVEDGVAVVEVRGEVNKYCCTPHSSLASTSAAIRAATSNGDVKALIVRIDSPGGSWMGMADVKDAIARAKQRMKVYTYASDMALSLGEWIFALGDVAVANEMSMVGGIGCYVVLTDTSGLDASIGIKKITVKAGENKAEGADGVVTEKLIDEAQSIVDRLHKNFTDDIKANREGWDGSHADGEVLFADQARRVGLVDDIMPFDDLLALVKEEVMTTDSKTKVEVKPVVTKPTVAAKTAVAAKAESAPPEEDKKLKALEDENEELKSQLKEQEDAEKREERMSELEKENEELKSKLQEKDEKKDEDETKALETVIANAKAAGINIEGDSLDVVSKQLAALAKHGSAKPQGSSGEAASSIKMEEAKKIEADYIGRLGRFRGPLRMRKEQPDAFKLLRGIKS